MRPLPAAGLLQVGPLYEGPSAIGLNAVCIPDLFVSNKVRRFGMMTTPSVGKSMQCVLAEKHS